MSLPEIWSRLLSLLPFGHSGAPSEHYFALQIGLNSLRASVWTIDDNRVYLLDTITLPYRGEGEIVKAGIQALDQALGVSTMEPSKILFGVPDSWSVEDNLKEQYLKVLKELVRQYQLTPLAFVTSSHALSHYLHQSDGVLPSLVLLGIGPAVEGSLLRAGKVVDSRSNPRGDHLFDDIQQTILQFADGASLPSKVVVYSSGQEAVGSAGELDTFPWMEKLPFLHFPKIEILPPEVLNQAVIFAGAFELNPNLSLKQSFLKTAENEAPRLASRSEKHLANDSGFMVGDISKRPSADSLQQTALSDSLSPMQVVANLQQKIQLPSFKNRRLMVLPAIILGLLVLYLLASKAEVTVFVDPKVVEKESTITADPKVKEVDENLKVIPGKVVETAVGGTSKGTASGQKQIGNPARGKVIIYNLSSQKVTLASGAQLTAGNGLKFTLDTSVQVASQSSSVGSDFTTVIKPGKSDPTGITASEIGPDSNLTAGSEVTVGSYAKSALIGKVDEALSGGTSKAVTVVTSDDQKKLQAQLLSELRVKAQEELQGKLTGDLKVIPEGLSVVDSKYSFSKAVNDQAGEFSLNANLRFRGVSYSDNDLKRIVAKLVETNVPEGYELYLEGSETSAGVAKMEKDDRLIFNAKFRAKLLPKFNTEELKGRLRFKTAQGAIAELKKYENIIGAQIITTPRLPNIIALIPLLNSNISVKVSPK